MELWVEEQHREMVAMRFRVNNVLFSEQSKFQKVDIVETKALGRMLLNDGIIMISEQDEFVYHEMISHVPLFAHPRPENVLIIGGGDGGSVREVIRHPSVERCRLVEIDEVVVRACKEFLPQTSACLTDSKVTVTITDGVEFVRTTDEKYDVVIVDSTDPVGPGIVLFEKPFYENVKNILNSNGILVAQAESPYYEIAMQKSILENLHGLFARTHLYNYSNLTYPGGLWSFVYASDTVCPLRQFDPQRVEQSKFQTNYYNAGVHRAAFALPEFMLAKLGELLSPLPEGCK